MKGHWKIPAFLMAVALIIGLASCTQAPKTTSTPATSGQSSESPAPETTTREEYVAKILVPMSIDPNIVYSTETLIGQKIKDKLNVVFEYIPITGDQNERVNMLLATGDYPEIVNINNNETLIKYIDAGAAISLEPYIANSPNFQKVYEVQIPYWRDYSEKNEVYCYGGAGGDITGKTGYVAGDITVRSDVLEKQGWPQLKKASDWIPFLKQALIDFPETNGKNSIALTTTFAEVWGLQGIAAIGYEKGANTTANVGNGAVIWNHTENKFIDYFLNPECHETITWFNTLYREGLLDMECFTDLYQQTCDKVNSGQALSIWYSGWQAAEANKYFRENGHPEMEYVGVPFQLDSQYDSKQVRTFILSVAGNGGNVITKNAKDPARIFEVLEYACTEEGSILVSAGIEGITYNIVDGKRVISPSYVANWGNFAWMKPIGLAY